MSRQTNTGRQPRVPDLNKRAESVGNLEGHRDLPVYLVTEFKGSIGESVRLVGESLRSVGESVRSVGESVRLYINTRRGSFTRVSDHQIPAPCT